MSLSVKKVLLLHSNFPFRKGPKYLSLGFGKSIFKTNNFSAKNTRSICCCYFLNVDHIFFFMNVCWLLDVSSHVWSQFFLWLSRMGVSFVFSIPNISGQKEKEEAVYLVLKTSTFCTWEGRLNNRVLWFGKEKTTKLNVYYHSILLLFDQQSH